MRVCFKRLESRDDLLRVTDRPIRSLSTPACQGSASHMTLGAHLFAELSAYTCVRSLCQKGPGFTWVHLPSATRAAVQRLISCQEKPCSRPLPGSTACTWTGAEGRSVLALQDTSLLPTQSLGTCFPSPVAMAVQADCVSCRLAGGSGRGHGLQAKTQPFPALN